MGLFTIIVNLAGLVERVSSLDRVYKLDLVDKQGVVHASVEKVIYVRPK